MIMVAGTIKNAAQLQALDNKWQQKKDSGHILSKEERNERKNWTEEEWLSHNFKEQCDQEKEADRITKISNKIMNGETLTPEEEKYLEQKNPEVLKKYKEAKAEKKAYEEKLKNCKTKDEVQRLKTETLGGYLASLKKVINDPAIPMSEKLAKAQEMLAKTKNIIEAERRFMTTAEYANLPTEAEQAEERAEERKLENEMITEEIKKSVKAHTERMEELTVETSEAPEEGEIELDEEIRDPDSGRNKKEKESTSETDYAEEIEKIFEQVKINVQLEESERKGNNIKSVGESGMQVNISV